MDTDCENSSESINERLKVNSSTDNLQNLQQDESYQSGVQGIFFCLDKI